MLGSHNVLNPANGAPITVPSQDMVLGLYYITKPPRGRERAKDCVFYGPEEAIIAYNEKRADLHAKVKFRWMTSTRTAIRMTEVDRYDGRPHPVQPHVVPKEVGYINEMLTKRSLRDIIGPWSMKKCRCRQAYGRSSSTTSRRMGYQMAFQRRPVVQPRRR